MLPAYDEKEEKLYLIHKRSQHAPPHLHESLEFIYVTEGSLALGIEQEFFPMEQGDFALIFPNVIHHYQVFSPGKNSAFYGYVPLSLARQFRTDLQKCSPKLPVIPKAEVHRDIPAAVRSLFEGGTGTLLIEQAYVQILLARSMPLLTLEERSTDSGDLIYQTVSYIAGHFKEDLSLDKLAKALGASKFALSRVFSSTFHKNFNQYLNEQRLQFVCSSLEYSDFPVTEICLEAGFQSQRTFNRAFQEVYRMTPREYRKRCRAQHSV